MATQSKNWWVPAVLVAAGFIIFFSSIKHNNTSSRKVVMQEVFNQKPSAAIVASPEHGQEAGFAVQVYSFQNQKKAEAALADLKNGGYNHAYITVSDLGEKGVWYRVRIGGLENETQARALLETIRKNYNSGFMIKPQKQ